MEKTPHHLPEGIERDALVEALLAPRENSFVDALLAFPDQGAAARASQVPSAIHGGLQAALARKMRTVLESGRDQRRAA